jgi:hypothetical protein
MAQKVAFFAPQYGFLHHATDRAVCEWRAHTACK